MNVTWEVATQANIGFESLFFNKLSFEFDFFRNYRTDILWNKNASYPKTAGITPPRENIGEVINRGIDFLIGYRDRISGLDYDISINGGYAKNEIKYWDEVPGRPKY